MDVFIHPRFEDRYRQHPLVLVDVGARGGLRSDWLPAKRHLRLIGFEPDQREYEQLARNLPQDGTVTFFDKALHNRSGQIDLRITKNPALTSTFEPNRAFLDSFPEPDRFDVVKQVVVDACPLDELLAGQQRTDVDFLKVDTQGSELLVIEGAAGSLANSAVGVEVEVEFSPLYRDQPLFADVDAALRRLGYSLFDLRPCYWKRSAGVKAGGPYGQLVWADALYLKDIPVLRRNVAGLPPDLQKSKLLRAMSVSLLYGYWDYALEIAHTTRDCFDADEQVALIESLERGGRSAHRGTTFPGQRLLSAVFRRLWKLTAPAVDGWSVGGARLGNRRS